MIGNKVSVDDEFGRRLAQMLSIAPTSATLCYELNEANWDSMTMISAIALIDETYDITVPVAEVAKCRNVAELVALVHSMLLRTSSLTRDLDRPPDNDGNA